MKNNILSSKQYGLIVVMLSFVFKFSMLPGLMSSIAGRDVWVVIGAVAMMEAITLIIIVRVSALGGMEAVKEHYGAAIYLLISLPTAVVAVLKIAVYMSDVNNFTTSYLFYNISEMKLSVILGVAVIYLAVRSGKGIGRVAEVAIWSIPLVPMIGVIFGKIHIEPSFILPVCAEGAEPIAGAFDKYMFWFFDYTPLLFFRIRKGEEVPSKRAAKSKRTIGTAASELYRKIKPLLPIIIGGSVALLGLPLMYALFVMVYGLSGRLISNAFSSLGSFNVVNTEIGSIDWPAIVVWLSYSVIVLAVMGFAAGKALENRRISHKITVAIAILVALVLTLTAFYNSERALQFATGNIRYAVAAVNTLAPSLALALLEAKRHKKNKAAEERSGRVGGQENAASI